MPRVLFASLLLLCAALPATAADGMISVQSPYSVAETAERLVSVVKERGMTVFDRVRHGQAAADVGIELRETELILFGNPKVGSPLMRCRQTVAIDLPQKALIWEDDQARTWISYNDPRFLEERHDIRGCEEVISKIEKALDGIATAASAP